MLGLVARRLVEGSRCVRIDRQPSAKVGDKGSWVGCEIVKEHGLDGVLELIGPPLNIVGVEADRQPVERSPSDNVAAFTPLALAGGDAVLK